MEKEIWRPVKDYENDYEVSNFGRVKSVKFNRNKIMKCKKTPLGYFVIGLRKNGGKKFYFVHRLVAYAFIPNPNNLPFINHKNEDKTDNRVENLEWCDATYNNNYGNRIKTATDKTRGRHNTKNSIPVCQYDLNNNLITVWPSAAEIKRQLGYDATSIARCCKKRPRYITAYGCIWRYKE